MFSLDVNNVYSLVARWFVIGMIPHDVAKTVTFRHKNIPQTLSSKNGSEHKAERQELVLDEPLQNYSSKAWSGNSPHFP